MIDKVTKVYPGGVKAVADAELTIGDGEFVVLVGPSGCGKTTTLRMVAGLEEITGGEISIDGRVVNNVPPKDRDIAMVFQNYALYPHMTVYNNLAFGLKMRKFKKAEIEKRVKQAAQLLGLDEFLNRKPKALSGGQRQRVAVGRAIVRDPKAFLFDEPLSNLDAKLRGVMRAELKELHHRLKTTTIYVTHDQEEAMSLGDRIVVMHDGIIRQVGRPLDVYDRPFDRFVAGFVGTPPMNFFAGELAANDGRMIFKVGDQSLTLPADMNELLQRYVGKEMTLGARPEHLVPLSDGAGEAGSTLAMDVAVSEPLGSVQDVYMSMADGMRVIARCDAHLRVKPDSKVPVQFRLDRVHVFEAGEVGKNVTRERNSNGVGA